MSVFIMALQDIVIIFSVAINLILIPSFILTINEDNPSADGSRIDKQVSDIVAIGEVLDGSSDVEIQNVDDEIHESDFIPTNEWTEIKPGQRIPAGLHVRINMQTGRKEAKYLSDDTNTNSVKQSSLDPDEIKRLLSSIKNEIPQELEDKVSNFRSIDEIKTEMKKLNIEIRTDYEIISNLVHKYKLSNTTAAEKVEILTELEYYLHQYDNAQDFVKAGGLNTIIIPALNSSLNDIRAAAAFLTGSAMQSNPPVQIAAFENGFLQEFLRMIIFESSLLVKSRVIYGLSCLVRGFPLAQQKFVQLGGVIALTHVFEKDSLEDQSLQLKVISLFHDLLSEKELLKHSKTEDDKMFLEKVKQYQRIGLKSALITNGWCPLFSRLLPSPVHDVREKVIRAMLTVTDECYKDFRKDYSILEQLQKEYSLLAESETNDQQNVDDENSEFYFTSLLKLIVELKNSVSNSRDEL